MASFSVFNYSSGGLSAKVDWSTTTYSSGCKLNATLSITAIYGWYFTINQGYSLKVKDTSGNVLKTVSGNTAGMNGTGTVTLLTISNLDIPYYGDKSVIIEANVNLTNIYHTNAGTYLSNYSKSQTCALPNIPGASTVTATDGNIGSSISIMVAKKVSSHTHTITYLFGELTGTIVTKSSETTIGFTIPTTFYSQIPNAKNGICRIYCTTYNSSGTQIGDTQSTTFTATASESLCKPTVSLTAVDSNATTKALTGDENKFIKYFSNANVTLTATAKNSATIKSRKITCGDGKSSTSSSATFNNVESANFTGSATDSREYSASATLNKTLINYIKLTCNVDIYRPEPTTGEVYLKVNGNYFNGSFGSVANTISLRYRFKESTSGTWSNWTSITATKSGNTHSYSGSLGKTFDYTKSYNFQINAYDKLMNLTVDKTVSQGIPVFDWGEEDFNFNVLVKGKRIIEEEKEFSIPVTIGVKTGWYLAMSGDFSYTTSKTFLISIQQVLGGSAGLLYINMRYETSINVNRFEWLTENNITSTNLKLKTDGNKFYLYLKTTSNYQQYYLKVLQEKVLGGWGYNQYTMHSPLLEETVDEPTGINPGDVIQTITNGNNTAIKYPDGTMICSGEVVLYGISTNSWGSIYSCSIDNPVTFPVKFKEISSVTATATTNTAYAFWVHRLLHDVNGITKIELSRPTSASNVESGFNYIAIGKWK